MEYWKYQYSQRSVQNLPYKHRHSGGSQTVALAPSGTVGGAVQLYSQFHQNITGISFVPVLLEVNLANIFTFLKPHNEDWQHFILLF